MMLYRDQIDNWNTVYDRDGLTVKMLDNDAVRLYLEGVPRFEMTLQEWMDVNNALEGVE